MNNENDDFKQIDRKVVTEATILDMELDMCHDPSEYNELQEYYRRLLYKYDLFEKPFVEDASESDYHEYTEEDDIAVITCENGKYGVQESWRFHKLDSIYDSIEQLDHSNLFKACYNGMFGVIDLDSNGKEVIPFEYDSIDVNWGDRFCAIVEKNGRFQYQCGGRSGWYDEIKYPKYAGWVIVRQDGRYGWLDENLNITFDIEKAHEHFIPSSYEMFNLVKEHHEATREDLNKCSELDMALQNCSEEDKEKLNEELLMLSASLYRGHKLYPFTSDGKMGVKDYFLGGGKIIQATYDEIKLISGDIDDACFGRKGNRWGLIADYSDKVESPIIEYDEPSHQFCYANWTVVKKNGKYGLYDTFEDKYLLEPIYDELIEKEDYHHIITRIGNRFGFYDTEFNVAPRFEQYKIGRSLSFIRFMLNGKWGFMDKNGERTDKIEEARACIRNPMY